MVAGGSMVASVADRACYRPKSVTSQGVFQASAATSLGAHSRNGDAGAGRQLKAVATDQQQPVSPTLHFSGARQAVCFVPR